MPLPRVTTACAALLLAAPPSPAGPAPDMAGLWTYVATCPGADGQPGATVRGEVFLRRVPGGGYEGALSNDLGLAAEVFATVAGDTVSSEIAWDGATTRALGLLGPDGSTWIVVDSEGCRSEFTRAGI
jgi:hypothetical protein